MMKKMLAVLLAVLVCMLSVVAGAEEAAAAIAPETVMATVAGEEITMAEVEAMAQQVIEYYNNYYGYDISGEDMRDDVLAVALGTLVQDKVIAIKGTELGVYALTDEETAEITERVAQSWEEAVTYYMQGYFAVTEESTDAEKADARVNALALLESMGYTQESLTQSELDYAKYDKVEAVMTAGAVVTEEAVMTAFNEQVAADEASYANDVGSYEYAQYYGGQPLYVPAGYRGVTQILLAVDEELLTAYQDLSEQLATQAADAETPVTQEQVDEALAAIQASIQPTYEEIVKKFSEGTAFEALIAEYNIDPGMSDPDNLANGYTVHKDSIIYDPQFVAAAFSVDEIGQMSQPYVGSYGAYVVYYLRDVPAGAVELTEELKAELSAALEENLREEAYTATLTQWISECDVQYTEAGEPYAVK